MRWKPGARQHDTAQQRTKQRDGRRQRPGQTCHQPRQRKPGQHTPKWVHRNQRRHAPKDRAARRKKSKNTKLLARRPARLDQAAPEGGKASPGQNGLMFINRGKQRYDRRHRRPGSFCRSNLLRADGNRMTRQKLLQKIKRSLPPL